MINFLKQNKLFAIFIFLTLLTAGFFHFLFLDRVPPGMSHDEVVYALSSETLFLNGTDITGTHLPLGFFQTPTEGNISLLPSLILSPLHFFMPVNQTTARLTYVFFLLLGSIAVYFIGESLFGNKKIAFLGVSIFLLEPWSFFLARFATEPPIALVFYLWATATLLRLRGWKLIIPFILFTLAFYSYHGGKIIFLPLIIVELIYLAAEKKLNKGEIWGFFLSCLFIFVSFFAISFNLPLSIVKDRQNELFFLNKSFLDTQVNTTRSLILQNSFTSIFVNKFTVIILTFLQKYITAFSAQVLFIQGDPRLLYSFMYHGLLYFFDAVFIPAGLFSLFLKKRKVFWLIIGIIIIAPLPSAVNAITDSYINRSILLLPIFALLSGLGAYEVYMYVSKRISQALSFALLFIVILGFVANFLFFFFYEYPFVVGDNYSIGEKIASQFIKHSWNGKKQLVVVTQEPGELYLETVFYFQNREVIRSFINNIPLFNKGTYQLSNIIFTGDCPKVNNSSTVYLVQDLRTCPILGQAHKWIKNPKDAGVIYSIYNNNTCTNIASPPWTLHSLQDYSMEKMDTQTFCEKWVSS